MTSVFWRTERKINYPPERKLERVLIQHGLNPPNSLSEMQAIWAAIVRNNMEVPESVQERYGIESRSFQAQEWAEEDQNAWWADE